ncbi:SdpI family protein [Clostridioides difficile]|nr:SdpI family protein [Clostridioides difficile]
MKKAINKQFILSTLICFIPFIVSIYFYNKLPNEVAIHFDNYGNPDNYAPKVIAAFGVPLLMLCIHLYTWFRLENEPKKANFSNVIQNLSKWGVAILSVILQIMMVLYSTGVSLESNFYTGLILGIIVILFGNYFPKCKRNYSVGIILPWTLNDEDNWNKTHHLAGWIWLIGGILLIINAFINIPFYNIFVIFVIVILPFIYSYLMYKISGKNN